MNNSEHQKYDFLMDEDVYTLLTDYATKQLGLRAGQADYQPESVVNSAIRGIVTRNDLLDIAKDEQHLRAMLYTAVQWKVIERLRRAGRCDNQGEHDQQIEDRRDGPLTMLMSLESMPVDDDAPQAEATTERVLAGCRNARDRLLLESRLLNDPPEPWSSVAERLGQTPGALKTAMTHLKPRLLEALIDPLRHRVTGEDWMILKFTIVQRTTGDKAAELTGLPVDVIRERLEDSLFPRLAAEIGLTGMAYLWKLHGGMERSSKKRGRD